MQWPLDHHISEKNEESVVWMVMFLPGNCEMYNVLFCVVDVLVCIEQMYILALRSNGMVISSGRSTGQKCNYPARTHHASHL